MSGIAKFYTLVEVGEAEGAFRVLLDGKPVKTPARTSLAVPGRALAMAIAEEWRAQETHVDPTTMPLTRLAFAAIDVARAHRERLVEEVLAFGRTDLLCYRAPSPDALVARQAHMWNPLLDWAKERYGAALKTGSGIAFVEQPAASLEALAQAVSACDDLALVALHSAATITGSLVLALALKETRLSGVEAFELSRIDETFQTEAWGVDAEAEARAQRLKGELAAVARFMVLLRP